MHGKSHPVLVLVDEGDDDSLYGRTSRMVLATAASVRYCEVRGTPHIGKNGASRVSWRQGRTFRWTRRRCAIYRFLSKDESDRSAASVRIVCGSAGSHVSLLLDNLAKGSIA
jgi:hypothetical protein